jgi:hypothetical protein
MTKTSLFVIFSLIFATFPAWTEDWTTTDGKTYKNVTVVSHDATVVTISSSDGMATFPITLLDKNLQKRVQGDDVTAKDWTVDGKDYHNVTVGNVEGAAATLFQHEQLLAYTIWYSNARMRVSGTAYFTLEIVTPNVSVHDDATDDISLVTTDSDAPKSDLSTSLASGGTNYIRWDAKTGKPFLTDSLSESFPDGSHVLDLVGPASDDFIDAMTKWPGLNANTPNSGTAPDPVPVNASFSFRKDNDDPNGPSSSMKSQSAKYGAGLLFSEYNEVSFLAWALKETRISYSNIPTFHQIYDPQAQARNAQSWNEDIAAYDDLQKGSTPPTAESLSKRLDDLTEMYGAYRDFRITRKLPPQPDKYGNADIYEVSLYATPTEQYRRDGTRSTTPQPDNGHDEPAYLVTIATSFSSKGSAEVLCTKNSTVSVKDADGFDKTETVYLENTIDPAVENRILDLQKQLHDIQK